MKPFITSVTLCVVVVGLSGCRIFRDSCETPPSGKEVATIAPLRVPPGLQAPDTRNALRIPELNEPPRPPRIGEDNCLESPPRYTVGWQPAPPPPEQQLPDATASPPQTDNGKRENSRKD